MNYNVILPSLPQTTTDTHCLSIFHFYYKLSLLATTSACLSDLPERVTQSLITEGLRVLANCNILRLGISLDNSVTVGQENTKRCPVVSSEFHTYSFLPQCVAETLVPSVWSLSPDKAVIPLRAQSPYVAALVCSSKIPIWRSFCYTSWLRVSFLWEPGPPTLQSPELWSWETQNPLISHWKWW